MAKRVLNLAANLHTETGCAIFKRRGEIKITPPVRFVLERWYEGQTHVSQLETQYKDVVTPSFVAPS